ncbi:hypothetical protein MACH09_45230 [Vibrio sp. MACH09]|uniref:hypothetical protein n=1 Tax=Vibrio sp. MACH09 TaxID=3025122 RepID=UPI00278D014B|nr:hypothetical protein [Vibrio sp. MACH09]GLO64015.1 hypothetical protein MACH09_45230 [Vibrio sp. MACH09]
MNMTDSNEFTQKDLMEHLLHRAMHTATHENLQAVESNLNQRIDRVESKIDKVESKIDRMQWIIIAGTITLLLKEYLPAALF